MKFKKDGRTFDNIEDARAVYCNGLHKCEACAIYRVLAHGNCREFCAKNPQTAAGLMEFEIIEDDQSPDKTQELPLDIGTMTLAQAKEHCRNFRLSHAGHCEEVGTCELRSRHICGDWPHEWEIVRDRLTPEELEICRAIGAKWASKDRHKMSNIEFWKDKPVLSGDGFTYSGGERLAYLPCHCLPSLKPGDCICVDGAGG